MEMLPEPGLGTLRVLVLSRAVDPCSSQVWLSCIHDTYFRATKCFHTRRIDLDATATKTPTYPRKLV